jgi:hypothetical protein|tara:strand:+ start:258 stop:527 length:270 start_codon:yes stop_codon:yes gene_type:complete
MQVDLNLKNIALTLTLLSALIGNVFIVGKVYSDFEIIKTKVVLLEESQNVLSIKHEILELGYKIKGIKLQIDPEYRTLCQKDMSNIVCQ